MDNKKSFKHNWKCLQFRVHYARYIFINLISAFTFLYFLFYLCLLNLRVFNFENAGSNTQNIFKKKL